MKVLVIRLFSYMVSKCSIRIHGESVPLLMLMKGIVTFILKIETKMMISLPGEGVCSVTSSLKLQEPRRGVQIKAEVVVTLDLSGEAVDRVSGRQLMTMVIGRT